MWQAPELSTAHKSAHLVRPALLFSYNFCAHYNSASCLALLATFPAHRDLLNCSYMPVLRRHTFPFACGGLLYRHTVFWNYFVAAVCAQQMQWCHYTMVVIPQVSVAKSRGIVGMACPMACLIPVSKFKSVESFLFGILRLTFR